MQAPHLSLTIQARGMLDPTFTRVYFADEEAANAADPVLQSVPDARRTTLIAERVDEHRFVGADLPLRHPLSGQTMKPSSSTSER